MKRERRFEMQKAEKVLRAWSRRGYELFQEPEKKKQHRSKRGHIRASSFIADYFHLAFGKFITIEYRGQAHLGAG